MDVTDRFQLDTLRAPNSPARPTIPYSQFPRPSLPHLSTHFDHSSRASGDENSHATKPASSTHPHNIKLHMDPATPSGHRRRRSSLMSNSKRGPHTQGTSSQRLKAPNGLDGMRDEQKWSEWSEDDNRESPDDSMSASEEEGLNDDEETGLTGQDKSRRTRKGTRNTLLDQRIVADANITQEENEATQTLIRKMAINSLLIGLWYLFSLSISIYNKWMFSENHLNFPFPLFTTSMHMAVQFSLASLVLYFLPRFKPRYNSLSNQHDVHVTEADLARHEEEAKKPLMTRWFYCTRLGPCGMATGLDIGLGNMSLKFISLTFYTMCKSSTLAFVLMFAFLFHLETPSWRLVAIIATMTAGVIMMVFGEVAFSALGFILIISATFFSGFRWALTQILLLRNPATSNPFSSIFFLAPIMFLTLLILAVPVEGLPDLVEGFHKLVADKGTFMGPVILLFPGVIAFLMTASEFALLKRTSVVTLSIAGIFKEVVTIAASGLIFDDRLTPINVSGLFVTIGAIAAYNYIKITKMREETIQQVHKSHAATGHSRSDANEEDGNKWEREDCQVTNHDNHPSTCSPGANSAKTAAGAVPVLGKVEQS